MRRCVAAFVGLLILATAVPALAAIPAAGVYVEAGIYDFNWNPLAEISREDPSFADVNAFEYDANPPHDMFAEGRARAAVPGDTGSKSFVDLRAGTQRAKSKAIQTTHWRVVPMPMPAPVGASALAGPPLPDIPINVSGTVTGFLELRGPLLELWGPGILAAGVGFQVDLFVGSAAPITAEVGVATLDAYGTPYPNYGPRFARGGGWASDWWAFDYDEWWARADCDYAFSHEGITEVTLGETFAIQTSIETKVSNFLPLDLAEANFFDSLSLVPSISTPGYMLVQVPPPAPIPEPSALMIWPLLFTLGMSTIWWRRQKVA